MPGLSNPVLPNENWDSYREYAPVDYTGVSWNNRFWLCPVCATTNPVLHHQCRGCLKRREKKVVGHNRLGNPVEKWVMHR